MTMAAKLLFVVLCVSVLRATSNEAKDGSGSGSGAKKLTAKDGSGSGSGSGVRKPIAKDGSGSGSGAKAKDGSGSGARKPIAKDGSGSGSGAKKLTGTVRGSGSGSGSGVQKPIGKEVKKRKVRKIASKATDCGKIPEDAKLTKDICEEKKESLWACAKKANAKVKKCAKLRNKKIRKMKKKMLRFEQKLKGIDFSKPNDAKTIKKKEKYEATVLKLYKATSGVFTYTEDKSRARRKLSGEKTYTAKADLNTNSDAESDEAKQVSASAVADELKKDDDFKEVTVEASEVEVEEVEVEEIDEEGVLELSMSATTSITTVFVFGLMSMMDF